MTKTRGFAFGAGGDDIADFNLFIVNDDAINQGSLGITVVPARYRGRGKDAWG